METATYKNTLSFHKYVETLIPPGFHKVKILRVCDGDTVWAAFDMNGMIVKQKIRFRNINTSELRSGDEQSRLDGKEQRLFVKNLIEDQIITVQVTGLCTDPDYRVLAFLFPDRCMWEKCDSIDNYDEVFDMVGGIDDCMELNEYMILTDRADKFLYEPRQ